MVRSIEALSRRILRIHNMEDSIFEFLVEIELILFLYILSLD